MVADACACWRDALWSPRQVHRFEGQLSVFKPHIEGPACYRCLYPEAPPEGAVPTCSEAGVLGGAVTGVMGTLQAAEVLKEILGVGETLAGKLLIWDGALATLLPHRATARRPALCAVYQSRGYHQGPVAAPPRRSTPVPAEPLGILLLSGAHDRAHYAFVLASGAAALGRQVVLFATNAGCPRLADRLVRPRRYRSRCARPRPPAWRASTNCEKRRASWASA